VLSCPFRVWARARWQALLALPDLRPTLSIRDELVRRARANNPPRLLFLLPREQFESDGGVQSWASVGCWPRPSSGKPRVYGGHGRVGSNRCGVGGGSSVARMGDVVAGGCWWDRVNGVVQWAGRSKVR